MEKEKKIEKTTKKPVNIPKRAPNRFQARRERKIALQQDVTNNLSLFNFTISTPIHVF
jgi:hypothetical protein